MRKIPRGTLEAATGTLGHARSKKKANGSGAGKGAKSRSWGQTHTGMGHSSFGLVEKWPLTQRQNPADARPRPNDTPLNCHLRSPVYPHCFLSLVDLHDDA